MCSSIRNRTAYAYEANNVNKDSPFVLQLGILIPKGRAPLGQHQELRPVARSEFLSMCREFVSYLSQSYLSVFTLSMCRSAASRDENDIWVLLDTQ